MTICPTTHSAKPAKSTFRKYARNTVLRHLPGDNTLICPGQLVSQNGKSVEKLTLGTEKNDGLAARLREIFGCEVTFE